jgi:DNA-binding CsgD family transcriptional regulator
MDGLPDEVIVCARQLARRTGIDEPSALSFCAEAWSQHEDPLWRTVALRDCIDERRHTSGQFADGDHRPLAVLDAPVGDGAHTFGELMPCEEHGYEHVEARCDLARIVAGLDDHDLATLARIYWLGENFPSDGPPAVAAMRALRRARRHPKPAQPLTPRQMQIVALLADGLTVTAIAHQLHIAEPTVKAHLKGLYAALHAANGTHAVAIALRSSIIA